MNTALPTIPPALRAQMQTVETGWEGKERAALLLFEAQVQAALAVGDWDAFHAANVARRFAHRALSLRAQHTISESVYMNSWWCLHHLKPADLAHLYTEAQPAEQLAPQPTPQPPAAKAQALSWAL